MADGPRVRVEIAGTAKDVLAGLIFVVLGAGFAIGATAYPVGDLLRMGPGYFPLVVGALLALIGGLTVVKGVLVPEPGAVERPSVRALLLVLGALLLFGLTVRGLGLVPAVFGAALMAAFGSERTSPLAGLAIAAGLTALSVLIFVVALSLRLPLFGPWIPAA